MRPTSAGWAEAKETRRKTARTEETRASFFPEGRGRVRRGRRTEGSLNLGFSFPRRRESRASREWTPPASPKRVEAGASAGVAEGAGPGSSFGGIVAPGLVA